jgi:proliferating cell nuclear antigen
MSSENSSLYKLEVKTVQTNAFKTLCEALKEILTDTNIIFSEDGIKIIAMDPSHTVLVHLKLDKNSFEEYHCNEKVIVGISMLNFFKLIKTMTNNDTLTLFIEKSDENKLGIRIENGEKNSITTYKLNLMDLNEDNITIPPAAFESIITLPSTDFQKICRDMSNLSDTIEIKSVGQQLVFGCNGNFASQETVIGQTSAGLSFVKTTDSTDIIQGYYNLKHLVLFTKCTNLCNQIEIYMKNNFPIVIRFAVGSLGSLKLALAPQCQQND